MNLDKIIKDFFRDKPEFKGERYLEDTYDCVKVTSGDRCATADIHDMGKEKLISTLEELCAMISLDFHS